MRRWTALGVAHARVVVGAGCAAAWRGPLLAEASHDGGGHEALHHIPGDVTGDQQHACQAATGGTRRGASFPTATAASVGSGVRRHLRADTPRCDGGTWCGVTIQEDLLEQKP